MFAGLPNLSWLSIYNNQIVTIEIGSFHDNIALTILWLYNNQLETLPQCVFDPSNHPAALNNLRIYNNPLQCNSTLCWLKHSDGTWIRVYSGHLTECAGPTLLASQTWNMITTADLNCGPPGEYPATCTLTICDQHT